MSQTYTPPAITPGMAAAAAKAWRDVIANGAVHDAGADSPQMEFAQKLANTAAAEVAATTTTEQLDRFEKCLAQLIVEQQLRQVRTDYDPDAVLRQAAEEAGLPVAEKSTFPWKSYTALHDGQVYAAFGYGRKSEMIYNEQPAAAS